MEQVAHVTRVSTLITLIALPVGLYNGSLVAREPDNDSLLAGALYGDNPLLRLLNQITMPYMSACWVLQLPAICTIVLAFNGHVRVFGSWAVKTQQQAARELHGDAQVVDITVPSHGIFEGVPTNGRSRSDAVLEGNPMHPMAMRPEASTLEQCPVSGRRFVNMSVIQKSRDSLLQRTSCLNASFSNWFLVSVFCLVGIVVIILSHVLTHSRMMSTTSQIIELFWVLTGVMWLGAFQVCATSVHSSGEELAYVLHFVEVADNKVPLLNMIISSVERDQVAIRLGQVALTSRLSLRLVSIAFTLFAMVSGVSE
jgi:hypothetical protein